ncbi:MAG: diguanylate cyclase [Candidatus Omnitrophota bacterium]
MKMNFSISEISLNRKIWISIALISLIPLAVFTYYFLGYRITTLAAAALSFVIVLGWWTVFTVFQSIIKVYTRSKAALENIGAETPAIPDEVQSLDSVISLLSDKVKNSFIQLQDFTKMTAELNREVSKKVLILSTILQANDLFSKNTPAEDVIKFISRHLKQLLGVQICFCSLKNSILGKLQVIACEGVEFSTVNDFLEKRSKEFSKMRERAIFDTKNKTAAYSLWPKDLGVKNIIVDPVISKGQVVGMVAVGDSEEKEFYDKDDLEVLNLFSQNVTLIWERERLSTKIEELEIMDDLTGLYNEKMVVKRLEEEIRRASAYQRACGFVTVKVENHTDYQKKFGLIETEKMFKGIAKVFKSALRPIDIAGRIGPDTLGVILIESNKRQSEEIAVNLKHKLTEAYKDAVELCFSVAESPINGASAQELIEYALKNKT